MYDVFYRCYPYKLFLAKEGQSAVVSILETFNIPEPTTNDTMISNVGRKNEEENSVDVSIKHSTGELGLNVSRRFLKKRTNFINLGIIFQAYIFYVQVSCGTKEINERSQDNKYVETNYQNNLLANLLESHLVSDICLIGPKGCGKSITVQTLANLLGYEVEPVVLYQASLSELIQINKLSN